jgi:ABC-type nitrate/sulfonate/bicarbonate transport system permease component
MTAVSKTHPDMARRVIVIKLATIACLVAAWELTARSGLLFEGVVPSAITVANAILRELLDPGFYRDLGVTLFASFSGFVIGSAIAISLGILLGISPFMRKMIEPFITALGGTPKIIFLPILFLVFGLGIESKIAKSALSTFFPVVLSTASGFVQIPAILLRVGQSFHLGPWQTVSKIYVPAMASPLLTGLRLGLAMAIIGVLSAEIVFSDSGLGFRLIRYADQFKIPYVYALVILIFAVAATINFALTKVQDHFRRHERGSAIDDSKLRNLATMSRS